MINKIINKYKSVGLKETIKWGFTGVKRKLKVHKKTQEGNIKLNQNNPALIAKNGRRVFVFGSVPFHDIGGGQRSAQLSKIFNKMGYMVYYVYGFKSSESKIFEIEIPTVKHIFVNDYKITDFTNDVREDDLVIFEAPIKSFLPFLNHANDSKAKIIYENIDNWETSLGSSVFDEETLKNMLTKATFITGTAKPLVEQIKKYFKKYKIKEKPVLYLANAVDDNVFEPRLSYEKPVDLVTGEKTLIYYGSLWGDWFDWDLIFGIAKKYKKYSINLIGDYHGIPEKVSKAPSNVHFLGLKKQIELPAYLKHSDIALLPFKVDEIGEYVSPLKIFEYIAMNKIVLTTKLPDVIGYPNTYYGNTVAEWNKILEQEFNNDIHASKEFISQNNWFGRCEKMIDQAYPKSAKKIDNKYYNNISVVILNYNNDKVIFDCVNGLIKYNKRYNYEIVVVDNQSSDGSYEKLKLYKDKIKLLRNEKNGCSSGRNLGFKNASNDYILFLDSDENPINSYWLDSFIEIHSNVGNIGAVGWNAGWFNKKGYAEQYVESYPYRYMPANIIGRSDIGYLATCGFLVKKSLLKKIEGFDEFYDPTCYEDTDLSLLIRDAGYELVYSTHLGVFHLPHQTTQSGSEKHKKLMEEKGNYFVKKWNKRNKKLLDYLK